MFEDGLGSCESVGKTSSGRCTTVKFKLRRQIAAAPGKKESTSLSLFLEVNDCEVEEELSTKAMPAWAEGVWIGKWATEQNEAWRKQVFEVQTWRQLNW